MKVKVAQLGPTLCDPMDCSPPGSSVYGILQARILEWVAIPFSKGSSQTSVFPALFKVMGTVQDKQVLEITFKSYAMHVEKRIICTKSIISSCLNACVDCINYRAGIISYNKLAYSLKLSYSLGFPGGSVVKNSPANQFDPWVRNMPWRRKWQPTSSICAWEIPCTEEPGGLQSTWSLKSWTQLSD